MLFCFLYSRANEECMPCRIIQNNMTPHSFLCDYFIKTGKNMLYFKMKSKKKEILKICCFPIAIVPTLQRQYY